MKIAVMSFPTRMLAGPDALRTIADEVTQLGGSRPLIVSDPGLQETGIVDKAMRILKEAGLSCSRYLDISKNPTDQNVRHGVECYRRNKADVLIGLGGGAAIDVAKTIRLKATHDLPLLEYDDRRDGSKKIHRHQPKMIAIPTTAGTGSEVGRASAICIGESNEKVIVFSPYMMPEVAILDAELTVSLPSHLTAATGFDALTHALEAYVAEGEHPFCDVMALSALARIGIFLPRAVNNGSDLQARHEMLLASSQAAIAFQKGLGACHALAHPLSAVAGLHHGLANAIMLPHVVDFNAKAASSRYATAARALGAKPSAQGLRSWLEQTLRDFSLPTTLSSQGVTADHFEAMISQATRDAAKKHNPRPLTPSAAQNLYQNAL